MELLASLHPKLVHFPIALLTTYILFEFLGLITNKDYFSKSAHILLFLGVLGTLAAVLTGNQAMEMVKEFHATQVPAEVLEEHETLANYMFWYFFIILVFRTYLVIKKRLTKKALIIIMVNCLLAFGLLYATAHEGGELVFEYGAGTELLKTIK